MYLPKINLISLPSFELCRGQIYYTYTHIHTNTQTFSRKRIFRLREIRNVENHRNLGVEKFHRYQAFSLRKQNALFTKNPRHVSHYLSKISTSYTEQNFRDSDSHSCWRSVAIDFCTGSASLAHWVCQSNGSGKCVNITLRIGVRGNYLLLLASLM